MNEKTRKNKPSFFRLYTALALIVITVAVVLFAVALRPRLSIKLIGDSEIAVEYGESYTDMGAKALYGRKEYSPVTVEGEVNTSKIGTYVITYTVTRNKTVKQVQRTVRVCDTKPPVITVNGQAVGYKGEPVADIALSFTAIDNVDGNCTARVERINNADNIVLKVTDRSGNEASVTLPVKFIVDPGRRVIYLTFDDGPSPNTPYILDILKQYGVKATFFVTGQHEESFGTIKRIHAEGHTVAAHTYSHKWEIYKSQEDYFSDLDKINGIIKKYTGKPSTLIRFPGGSSNKVSKQYKVGIMTELAAETQKRGYSYFDWNIDSMDTSTTDPDKVFNNITSHLGNGYYNVLMHDTKLVHREALPRVIEYCLDNGYRFLPLDETSPSTHHSIRN
ncbi:MAG: polysaccharide deacetylase family protein [Clostridia bacterium]|nr:polysaccharide deacetylase family protein [Clostridia bacterium]